MFILYILFLDIIYFTLQECNEMTIVNWLKINNYLIITFYHDSHR